MSKQTAVEWLEEIYLTTGIDRNVHFNQAKEMEKEQIGYSEEDMKEAFIAGGNSNITEDDGYGSRYLKYMDKWFKQFKKK
jgi:hypothetical protein